MRGHGDNVDAQHHVNVNIDKHWYLDNEQRNTDVYINDVINIVIDIDKHVDLNNNVNEHVDLDQYHCNKHIIDHPNHDLSSHDDNVVTDKHVDIDINSDDYSIDMCIQPLLEWRNVC